MILDKEVEIKITKINIDYYMQFYKDISLKDVIKINPLQLQKKSNFKLNVQCDICETKRYIKYQAYTKNIDSSKKYPIYTCDRCSHIKLKAYNIENYGVEYYSQHPDRNEKVKKTNLERYGVDHFSKSLLFKEKVSKTNLEKFGYENPFMDKERIQSIFKEKYGVEHPSQVKEFSDKIKASNLISTGYESALSSPIIRNKINKTNQLKYDGHPMKNDNLRYLNTIIGRDKDYLSYEGNNISIFKCDKEHTFKISSDLYHNRLRNNLPLCTICYPIDENRSIKELELLDFIKSIYSDEVIHSYRNVLEIDIYLPNLKIGFEFNGLYWHSIEYKEKNYHLNKTNHFKEKGIKIIHIWEDDWDYKKEVIKSQIINWLGLNTNRIYARKCKVIEINIKDIRLFLNSNHIQGYVNSQRRYGLVYDNQIVSVISFDRFEGRKRMSDNEWNLNRFCNKLDINVIGGASKLLKHFIKENQPNRIISYSDKDWSTGDLYYKLGFNKISETDVDYKYIIENKRVHKSSFRKSNLDTELSESNYMFESGIFKIYDCGKMKFEMII